VVIATYNYGRYLPLALNSVLAQTFADFEVVVVDDGSNDCTSPVVKPFLEDARIKYLRTEHVGQPRAKNTGIRAARGRYVAFLDADDLWLPTKLEKQLELFRSDPELGVVYARRLWIDESGRRLRRTERPCHRGDVLAEMFWRNFICFSSSVAARSVLEEVGGFDENIPLAIDYDLWLRIALKYRFDYVDEQLVEYRTGHVSLSSRQMERAECVDGIMDRFVNRYGGRQRVSPALVRKTLADHCCDKAWIRREDSRIAALGLYLQALRLRPQHGAAWWGITTSWVPESFKDALRPFVGRRDWHSLEVVEPQQCHPARIAFRSEKSPT
jgi:glycosyltransferase involved in cell wall biosynthesis